MRYLFLNIYWKKNVYFVSLHHVKSYPNALSAGPVMLSNVDFHVNNFAFFEFTQRAWKQCMCFKYCGNSNTQELWPLKYYVKRKQRP